MTPKQRFALEHAIRLAESFADSAADWLQRAQDTGETGDAVRTLADLAAREADRVATLKSILVEYGS